MVHRLEGAGEPRQKGEQLDTLGLVEAGVLEAIGIFVGPEMLMMREMILVVEPRDRPDRTQNQEISEEVIGAARREDASMQPVVADDEQSVVARADNHRGRHVHPPRAARRRQRPRADDQRPAEQRVAHRDARAQRRQLAHTLRREERGAIRVVRIEVACVVSRAHIPNLC